MGKEEVEELRAVKKLLILDLIKSGATLEEIAIALGITVQRVSQILPPRKIKKYEQKQ
jgi:DNA invertase Pin-like site-specific DNA recombinase